MATESPYPHHAMASPRQDDPEKMQSGCYGKHRLVSGSIDGKFGGVYAITDANVDCVSKELPGMQPWGTRNDDGSYIYDDMTGVQLVAGQFLPGPFIQVTLNSGEVGVFDWGPQF